MVRLVYMLAMLALLDQATGYFSWAGSEATSCSQPCPDDDAGGRCPPDCPYCTCCPHTPPVTVGVSDIIFNTPAFPVRFHVSESRLTSVEPGDIFHVPKPSLA